MRGFRLSTTLVAAALALGLSACGSATVNHYGDNEGEIVTVGALKYQVEISRQLNPYDVEDRYYVQGLTPRQSVLSPADQWFGVFVLVQNNTSRAQLPATGFYITDAAHNVYLPTVIPGPNVFAYRPIAIPPHSYLPLPGSPAANGPAAGALVLFRLPYAADDNRPLNLHIFDTARPTQRAIVELDV